MPSDPRSNASASLCSLLEINDAFGRDMILEISAHEERIHMFNPAVYLLRNPDMEEGIKAAFSESVRGHIHIREDC